MLAAVKMILRKRNKRMTMTLMSLLTGLIPTKKEPIPLEAHLPWLEAQEMVAIDSIHSIFLSRIFDYWKRFHKGNTFNGID